RPFEKRRAVPGNAAAQTGNSPALAAVRAESSSDSRRSYELPEAPQRAPAAGGIDAGALSRRIDEFLSSRGYQPQSNVGLPPDRGAARQSARVERARTDAPFAAEAVQPVVEGHSGDFNQPPLDFVCEDDVRRAIRTGRKLS